MHLRIQVCGRILESKHSVNSLQINSLQINSGYVNSGHVNSGHVKFIQIT